MSALEAGSDVVTQTSSLPLMTRRGHEKVAWPRFIYNSRPTNGPPVRRADPAGLRHDASLGNWGLAWLCYWTGRDYDWSILKNALGWLKQFTPALAELFSATETCLTGGLHLEQSGVRTTARKSPQRSHPDLHGRQRADILQVAVHRGGRCAR